jgi:hypothetical protein
MSRRLGARLGAATLCAAGLACFMIGTGPTARAASPSSGTLTTTAPLTWDGFPGPGVSPQGEDTCIDGTTCDTFTFKIAAGSYIGKRVRFRISWQNELNDYDIYVHAGSNAGPEEARSGNSPPVTFETNTFDLNRIILTGVNDTFTAHVVYWAVGPNDPYHGELTIEDIPPSPTRTPTFIKGDKTGIRFSRSRALHAKGAGQDVEPSARVDYKGNAYVGAIRGLTGGNDIWRFDLNPNSPTYDPFLAAGVARFDLNGNPNNPSHKGQPDALHPNDESDLGGDGGGDLDIAVGFKPPKGAAPDADPTVAFTSLLAANISAQRSNDRAETYDRNPAGNHTVPVDDRQWNEFFGGDVVYLGYRELVGLQVTAKFYINRSDDGGLTYGPAILADTGGNTVGNIDVDQRDGTVYFCHQGPDTEGNKEVHVAVGHPVSLALPPAVYTKHVASKGHNNIGLLFPVCKAASDGTVYVAYSDGGGAIYMVHSLDQGKTWSPRVRVSDMSPGSVALAPWIETGERPGSVAIVWYGSEVVENEGATPGNTDKSNWKVYYAQTLNATASNPTILQTVATDVVHAANFSIAGLDVSGGGANRNLADFFQVAVDPSGHALIAYSSDVNDFAGHAFVTHQVAGPSLNTGKMMKVKGKDTAPAADASMPEVMDWRHDARLVGNPPTYPQTDTPADIISVDYGCALGGQQITATLRASGLDSLPALGTWRMHFATNASVPGASDRADQWYLEASIDVTGARSYWWGTAVRTPTGALTYTRRGAADAGHFDLVNRSVTVKVSVSQLNALQQRGAIGVGTVLLGLRGSATGSVIVPGAVSVNPISDSTRGGRTYTLGQGCS